MESRELRKLFGEKLPIARECFPVIKRRGVGRRLVYLTFDDTTSTVQGLEIQNGLHKGEVLTDTSPVYRGYALGVYDPSRTGEIMLLFSESIPDKGDVTSYTAYSLGSVKSLERKNP
ncbi:MAG: hypothetical protein PHF67_00720 [Candidatus Nanoarchaeia archaeon]|nr:hypothetical protein [Candidatus Nanoarchaeia archaeon]